MLKNLKIQFKILLLSGFLLLNILAVILISVLAMGKVARELDNIVKKDIPLTKLATKITEHQLEQEIEFERAIRYRKEGRIGDSNQARKYFLELDDKVTEEIKEGAELAEAAGESTTDPKLRAEIEAVIKQIAEIKDNHDLYSEHTREFFGALGAGNEERTAVLEPKIEKEAKILKEGIINFLERVEKFTGDALVAAEEHEKDAIQNIIIMSVAQVVIALIVSMLIGRDIGLRLRRVSGEIAEISRENNLSIRLDDTGRDEISTMSHQLNSFLSSIAEIMNELRDRAEAIADSSQGINETSQTLSSGSEELSQQAQSISSAATQMDQNLIVVASAVEEMTTSISEVTRQAVDAAGVASKANETAESTSQLVVELGQNAERIGVVTDTISQIADQTNLLALNAAIEAAGAGEAGKGFAVVASEVKELARQASEAAEDIKNRVMNVQKNTDQTVSAIEMIAEIISQLNEINSAIASAMEEQSITTREISSNVNQSSKAATEVTGSIANVSEVASSSARDATKTFQLADSLKDLSGRLENIVHQFKYDKSIAERS